MWKIIGWVVGAVVVLLGIGALSANCAGTFDSGTSPRDKAQEILQNVDSTTTKDDLATMIQDKFGNVSDLRANSIATSVIGSCKPDCQVLSDKLSAMKSSDANNQSKVLAKLASGSAPVTSANPQQTASSTNTSADQSSAPVAGNNQPQQASSVACRLQIVGPWSEINNAAPYRIEVGGGDVQHFDFYPTIGVQSISYIVPPLKRGGVAQKWYGYGQMWQGNGTDCANFDYVKDAIDYAKSNASGQPGRLQQGHSGIVIDLRGGDFKIVEKPAGWSDDQINSLIALHKAAMNPANPPSGTTASSSSSSSAQTTPGGACQAVQQTAATRPDGAASVVTLGGDGHAYVFELWNPAVQGGAQMKVLVPAGSSRTFTGFGGAIWQYPTTCTPDQIQQDYNQNPKPAYTG